MAGNKQFDVIIIGGSYAGLAAGMALGRALRRVLIIDSGERCNRQTPHSHNFITHDGRPPGEIATLAQKQVLAYDTVQLLNDRAVAGSKTADGFVIEVASGEKFHARKLAFATGIKDLLPDIGGLAACWGISVLHCPYCHGYEVRGEKTGILGNGEYGFDFAKLISNWTKDLTLYTNGASMLTADQAALLDKHAVRIIEKEIGRLEQTDGYVKQIIFKDGSRAAVKALYARSPFRQHCSIPEALGCALTEDGYIQTDVFQETTVKGVFACGDNATRIRTVANAVAMGTTAGIMINKDIVSETF